ncbi:Troponin I [Fasciola hepatica]|uniref:Troponin I n=1 Tax=Fasciola hepatica TaxID=6192 RepID=A0A4E0RE75_FASHE|nr:Troponin I [Fasciola hepatica]
MPVPSIEVDSDVDEIPASKIRPKPLINMPVIGISSDESEESDSESEVEDVMTAEEEAAARRYLSGGAEVEQRRPSSLDVYLSQPQQKTESMIINRRLSMREEQEQIAKMNADEMERNEEEERRKKLEKEREAVRKERESKAAVKGSSDIAQSPSPRRIAYHKRGFGGLSRERRKKLKEIIMRKAKEELRAETMKEMQKRENHLKSVLPPFNIDSLNEKQLHELLKSWHKQAKELEEQRIDLEERIRRQDEEISELTMKLVDIKGKYHMPILRKVPKRENIVARLERLRELNAMHVIKPAVSLKSVSKSMEVGAAKSELVNGIRE